MQLQPGGLEEAVELVDGLGRDGEQSVGGTLAILQDDMAIGGSLRRTGPSTS